MLPTEIHTRLYALIVPFGANANAYAMVTASSYCTKPHGMLMVYPLGTGTDGIVVHADTWEAAFDEAAAKLADWSAKRADTVVRRMALAIIEQTADTGGCTTEALVKGGFTEAELSAHGDAACAHAAKLARATFTIAGRDSAAAAE